MQEGYKECTKCHEVKPLEEFSKLRGGKRPNCRQCGRIQAKLRELRYRMEDSKKADTGTKICGGCKMELPITDFGIKKCNRGGHDALCKDCAFDREHKKMEDSNTRSTRAIARKYVETYKKSHPCIVCGETRIVALHFHHRDPGSKRFTISRGALKGFPVEVLQEEMDKCDMLCATHHAIRHEDEMLLEKAKRREAKQAAKLQAKIQAKLTAHGPAQVQAKVNAA
jgi:hypothetical protein